MVSSSSVHFVGIGGSGMQGLARYLKQKGVQVSGSDLEPVSLEGIPCYAPHHTAPLEVFQPQMMVYSPAIPENNVELQWALRRHVPIRSYPEQLGWEMKDKFGIAVAGTHGKSTTSTLIQHLLREAGRDPSFVIGAKVAPFEANGYYGEGREMVVEACEYQKSFLSLHYNIALINNIEEDHLDFYKDLEAIQHSFREFARKLKPKGCLILPEALYSGFQSLPFMVYRVGKSSFCEYQYYQMSTTAMGGAFYFRRRGNPFYRIETPLLGRHNLLNAAMALATAHQAGVSLEESAEALKTAQTPARRFQILQEEPFVIVDDFAHHPTKIARTFQTCRQRFPGQKIRCIFQAHQHHRTRVFLKSFGKILAQAEECYIPPIFSARDTLEEQTQTTASHLVKAIQQQGGSAQEWQSLEALHSYLFETAKAGDVLLILGAGDISLFAKQLALPLNGVQ